MNQHPIILAVHIPKTGGTTFKNMLRQNYKNKFIRIKPLFADKVTDDIKLAVQQHATADSPCVIYGHYCLDPFYEVFPNAKLAVWLRDPVQRLLSLYYFAARGNMGVSSDPNELYKEENLFNFISQPINQNTMSKMIGNHKIESFDFVGLTSEFDKSLDLFSKVFATKKLVAHSNKFVVGIYKLFNRNEIHIRSKKINPALKTKNYEISDGLRQEILKLNAEDYALYIAGKAHFQKLCEQWLP